MYEAMKKLVEFRNMIDPQDTLSNSLVRRLALRLVDREMPNPRKRIPVGPQLTNQEIDNGKFVGKVACVKAYRERTAKSLSDSLRDCVEYFSKNNLKFNGQ